MSNNTPIFLYTKHIGIIRNCSPDCSYRYMKKIKLHFSVKGKYITLDQYLAYVNQFENEFITLEHIYDSLSPKK